MPIQVHFVIPEKPDHTNYCVCETCRFIVQVTRIRSHTKEQRKEENAYVEWQNQIKKRKRELYPWSNF